MSNSENLRSEDYKIVLRKIHLTSLLEFRPVRLARLGHRVFIPATGVRIPYGTPFNRVLSLLIFPLGIYDAE